MKKTLMIGATVLVCSALFLAPGRSPASRAADQRMIEIILDASGSMAGKLSSGEKKLDAAKNAVAELAEKLPGETILAFRAYGHQFPKEKHDCTDTQLIVGFGPLSEGKGKIISINKSFQAKGYTPITYVLQKAAEDFPQDFAGERMIILVSDGKETCEGDPCAAAMALAKSRARLVIHTVGFGVDESTRAQLDCIARATGGKYFGAADTAQLLAGMSEAVRTSATMVVEKKGPGWLTMKYADLSGHEVTNVETGEKVATLSSLGSTAKLPAGIYNVTVGQSVWKSVVVKAGETTVLNPGLLEVKKASLEGHDVIDPETGAVQGQVSSLHNTVTLIPGEYQVMFGKLPWDVIIRAGEKTVVNPGTVEVQGAHYTGHKIFTKNGEYVGEVSNIQDTIPLPPGDYVIEIDEQKIPFTLKEGQDLKFERKT